MVSGIKRLQQEVQDLSHFASEKKGDKYELPSHIGILAEFTEVIMNLLYRGAYSQVL